MKAVPELAPTPAYDVALYNPQSRAQGVATLADADDNALETYVRDGFLAVERAFSPPEVEAACDGLAHLIAGSIEGFQGVHFEFGVDADALSSQERADAVRKVDYFVDFEPRLHAMAFAPSLLQVLTRIFGEAPALFQDIALLKPPRIGREKPWHQDKAYFDVAVETPIVGVWIALDEATIENGCMQMLAGGHKKGVIPHFHRRDWQICDAHMLGQHSVAVPLAPGGLVLFDGMIPHGTPANTSKMRRRALQFHYAPASATRVPMQERLAAFGAEGKNVSC